MFINWIINIEKKNPLKQGLKHKNYMVHPDNVLIEKKNPLKQGLKLPTENPAMRTP